MLIRNYLPKPPLSEFIQQFWLYEGYTQPHRKEHVMPDGAMALVINLKEAGDVVCGARSKFFVIGTEQQESVIGIWFKPGGAYPFFGLPAGELHNLQVSLSDLWGKRDDARLRERLLEAPLPENKFRI